MSRKHLYIKLIRMLLYNFECLCTDGTGRTKNGDASFQIVDTLFVIKKGQEYYWLNFTGKTMIRKRYNPWGLQVFHLSTTPGAGEVPRKVRRIPR
jgi:hypothetical protein